MHMSDALVSPAVGGALWAAAGGLAAWSARRVDAAHDERKVPLMGVLGAFVFAAQMVNFSIPGTGSSGHLGGGLLLAALVGPEAAFIVLFSVLGVQALFFADGGLLALGANAVNLGVPTAFVAYPLVFRRVLGRGAPGRARVLAASVSAAVVGLALGAALVALETALSGVSSLPLRSFLLLLVPVHVAIGVVEGLVTGALLAVLWRARPELAAPVAPAPAPRRSLRPVLVGLALAALVTGGALSALASTDPDGLEWAAARVAGAEPRAPAAGLHAIVARVQAATAVLPGYAVPGADARAGTSLSGVVGAVLALAVAALAGIALRAVARRARSRAAR
jgi:cobalt/nickel transport system permease protein